MAGVDDPVASPMSIVQDYIKSKGLGLTSENVRRTLEQAARDPEFMPALRTQEPPTDTRPPTARTKTAAPDIESKGPQPGYADPNQPGQEGNARINYPPGFAPGGSDTQTTSAQPGPNINVGEAVTLGLPVLGAGAYGAYRMLNGAPTPGGVVPPPVDPGAGVTSGAPRYNPEAFDPLQRPTPGYQAEGVVEGLGTPREVNPLATAIDRAVQPSAVGPSSPLAPMTPAAPGPGPDQTYLGNARPETSTTLEPQPIPIQPKRKVTIEEIPHPSAGVRPPARAPYVPRLMLR